MAVYRFRVFIEDNHEIYRDIEVQGRHDFADLHRAIVLAFGFQQGQPAEYVTSDSSWYTGDVVVSLDGDLKGNPTRIVSHVNDPHQRFLCVTMSHKPVELALELLKITAEAEDTVYPRCVKVHGDAPFYTQPPVKPMSSSDEDKEKEDDEEGGKKRKGRSEDDDEPTDDQLADEDTELLSDDTETASEGAEDGDMDTDSEEDDDEDEEDTSRFSNFDADEL